MNKSSIKDEEEEHTAIVNCPFLAFRSPYDESREESFKYIICEAGGGHVVGTTDSIAVAQKICHTCDIPTSLSLKYACLYLVPFRVFQGDHVQSYYGCRWYFRLNPRKVPTNMEWCIGCRDWFPRPRKFQVPGQIRISHKFRRIYLNPSEMIDRPFPVLTEEKQRWYEKLRDFFYW